MHSHSLHENTFLSGNISLTDNNTTTDYWIPLFSLYHGMFRYVNNPDQWCYFLHGCSIVWMKMLRERYMYSVAFDKFSHHTMDFIRANRNKGEDIQNTILLSKGFLIYNYICRKRMRGVSPPFTPGCLRGPNVNVAFKGQW